MGARPPYRTLTHHELVNVFAPTGVESALQCGRPANAICRREAVSVNEGSRARRWKETDVVNRETSRGFSVI
jgi:hypothetical protein